MTKEELAKQYHEKITERNPQAEAYDFQGAFIAGYDAAKDEFDRDLKEAKMTISDMKQKALDSFCNCICAGKRDIVLYHECKTCKLYYEFEELLNL